MSEFSNFYDFQNENATAKVALHIDIGVIKFSDSHPQRYIHWYKIPDYSLQVIHVGFVLAKNNFFFDVLDKNVQKMLSAGLIDPIINDCVQFVPFKFVQNESTIFTLNSLSFGFVIWFGCIGICMVVFLAEIIIQMPRKWLKKRPIMKARISKDAATQTEFNQKEIEEFVAILFKTIDKNIKK